MDYRARKSPHPSNAGIVNTMDAAASDGMGEASAAIPIVALLSTDFDKSFVSRWPTDALPLRLETVRIARPFGIVNRPSSVVTSKMTGCVARH